MSQKDFRWMTEGRSGTESQDKVDKILVPRALLVANLKSVSIMEKFSSTLSNQAMPSSNVVRGLGACQRTTKLLERQQEIIKEIRKNPPPPPPPALRSPIPREVVFKAVAAGIPIKEGNRTSCTTNCFN